MTDSETSPSNASTRASSSSQARPWKTCSVTWLKSGKRRRSVQILGVGRHWRHIDAFLDELPGFLDRALAIDVPLVAFSVMDLARFLGKLAPDILSILF